MFLGLHLACLDGFRVENNVIAIVGVSDSATNAHNRIDALSGLVGDGIGNNVDLTEIINKIEDLSGFVDQNAECLNIEATDRTGRSVGLNAVSECSVA